VVSGQVRRHAAQGLAPALLATGEQLQIALNRLEFFRRTAPRQSRPGAGQGAGLHDLSIHGLSEFAQLATAGRRRGILGAADIHGQGR